MEAEVIFGPPGTGKTRTIIDRIGDYGKDDFIFCSFTRAAAKEGLSRLGIDNTSKSRTLHSLAYEKARVARAQVVDRDKLQELSKITGYPISGRNIAESSEIQIGDELLALTTLAAAQMVSIEVLYGEIRPQISLPILISFAQAYETWKKRFGYLDFNDMLVKFTEGPPMRIGALFIDEAQDLSNLQWKAINHIKADRVCVAGDDDQSIYAWGGANPHGMTEFLKQHSCDPEILSQSYRLPERIWELSNSILKKIIERHEKEYSPHKEGGEIERLGLIEPLELKGESSLFLYRNYSNKWQLEEYLINNAIPYKTHNGWGMFDNHVAIAARKYNKLNDLNDNMARKSLQSLKSKIHPWMHDHLNSPDYFRNLSWDQAINSSPAQRHYLNSVDLDAEPKALLSTIHSAKGMEADHVVLSTSMGQRTWEGMSDDEHRVWYVAITRAKHTLTLIQGGLDYVI